MSEFDDNDVAQLAGVIRVRIGWPISAGEAGTFARIALDALVEAGWHKIDECVGYEPFVASGQEDSPAHNRP